MYCHRSRGPAEVSIGTNQAIGRDLIKVSLSHNGEHEELWGSLVTGRLYTVSGETKQGYGTSSLAKAHPIRTRLVWCFPISEDSAVQGLAGGHQPHDLAAGSGGDVTVTFGQGLVA